MGSRLQSYFRSVFSIDVRSLGAFRIVLGALLLIDLALRARFFEFFLTDAGPFPRDAIPYVPFLRSLFFISGDGSVQALLYGVMVTAAVMFTIGYKTRTATVILWFFIAAHHGRCPMVLTGEDRLPLQFLIWSIFLPMGARYSVDAMRKPRSGPATQYLSLASAAILLQFIALYAVTGVTKSGASWTDGTALWWSLGSEYWVLPLGRLLREHYGMTVVMTYIVPTFEWLAALTLLISYKRNVIRAVTIFLLFGFQMGLLFTIELRMFPLMSSVGLILFVPGSWWDRIRRRDASHSVSTEATDFDCGRSVFTVARDIGVGFLMILSAILALQCLATYRTLPFVPTWRAPGMLARQIGVNQEWPMYSPNPDSHEFKVKFAGIQEGKRVIELLEEPGGSRWGKVKEFHEAYRLLIYQEKLFHKHGKFPDLVTAYLDWICREWHADANEDDTVDAIRWFYETRDVRPVERQPRNMYFVAQHLCNPDVGDVGRTNPD
jgi:hypothetical protein